MADETQERIVLVDGYWHRHPVPGPGVTVGGAVIPRGSRVQVSQEEIDRAGFALGTQEDYDRLLEQEAGVLDAAAVPSVQATVPSSTVDDDTIAAMNVAEISAYLSQHSDDESELDRVEGIENERDGGPRVSVTKSIEAIRARAADTE